MTGNRADIEFTDLERDVLRMIVGNMSDVEIAFALDVEQSVVQKIVENITDKLGVQDRASAVALAVKLNLVKTEL